MELHEEKVAREAIAKYKKEQFRFWKDIILVGIAVGSLVINVFMS